MTLAALTRSLEPSTQLLTVPTTHLKTGIPFPYGVLPAHTAAVDFSRTSAASACTSRLGLGRFACRTGAPLAQALLLANGRDAFLFASSRKSRSFASEASLFVLGHRRGCVEVSLQDDELRLLVKWETGIGVGDCFGSENLTRR